jgi:hypothetical protein
MLASSGGAPLAFALDDESELQERLYLEGIRGSSSNPLSARYAIAARENREPPVIGGATDVMRREIEGHLDDQSTMARKLKSGHLGDPRNQSAFLTSETEIDPEIQAFINQSRPPTKKDFDGYSSKFTVKDIDQNGLNGYLQSDNVNPNPKHANFINNFQNIYNTMNGHQHIAGPAANLASVTPIQPPIQIPGMTTPATSRGRLSGSLQHQINTSRIGRPRNYARERYPRRSSRLGIDYESIDHYING